MYKYYIYYQVEKGKENKEGYIKYIGEDGAVLTNSKSEAYKYTSEEQCRSDMALLRKDQNMRGYRFRIVRVAA